MQLPWVPPQLKPCVALRPPSDVVEGHGTPRKPGGRPMAVEPQCTPGNAPLPVPAGSPRVLRSCASFELPEVPESPEPQITAGDPLETCIAPRQVQSPKASGFTPITSERTFSGRDSEPGAVRGDSAEPEDGSQVPLVLNDDVVRELNSELAADNVPSVPPLRRLQHSSRVVAEAARIRELALTGDGELSFWDNVEF